MSLIFLKLGGSLITDKSRPYTLRSEKLTDLAGRIAAAVHDHPDMQLVLGHGSGSFGHTAASQYNTHFGVSGPEAWRGFAEVWYQASSLNRIVVEALRNAGLPAITFSPLASVTAHDGKAFIWDHYPLQTALTNGLLPVVHGDVAVDDARGGTILSTEDLFEHLALGLHPNRILLAGLEEGVWADFPERTHLREELTPTELAGTVPGLQGSSATDVTGGMLSKVSGMLALVGELPDLEVLIFSGENPENLSKALDGENPGTLLHR